VSSLDRADFPIRDALGSARVLSTLMDHPTLAVAALQGGRIRRANARWHNLFGTRPDGGRDPSVASIFVGAKSAERFERLLAASFSNGAARVEHLLTCADGTTFMAEIVVHELTEDNAFGADALWQVRDITSERELRRELRELEEYYRALSTYQLDLTFVLDRELRICYASPSVETVLGYSAAELVGERAQRFIHPEEVSAAQNVFGRVLAGEIEPQQVSLITRVRHRDGAYRVLACRQRNCLDVPRISGVVVNGRDITEERLEQRLREENLVYAARLREALFGLATDSPDDVSGKLDLISRAAIAQLGVHSASFWRHDAERQLFRCEHCQLSGETGAVANPMRELIAEDEFPMYVRQIHLHRPIVVNNVLEHPAVSAHHVERLARANVGAMLDVPVVRDHKTLGVLSLEWSGATRIWQPEEISFAAGLSLLVALAIESAERAAAAERTEYMAMHDALTGLANRNRAETELRAALAQASDTGCNVGLLLIDLDEFKEINDNFGHGRGDTLLVQVAAILLECAGPEAMVARMGGDEFLIIVRDSREARTQSLAQSIVERLAGAQLLSGIDHPIGASIGIAQYPEDASDAEALLAHADIAMYQAKGAGKNQYFAFNSVIAQRLRVQRELDGEIREALSARQFSLFYQPQVDLNSGAVIGLEALLRWEHPKRGLLLPRTFMAAAEHSGLIDPLTKWALTEACEQNVVWQKLGLGNVPISVNVTARQFHDPHLPSIIAATLMKTGLSARHLILEVTEENLLENNKTSERVLAELRALGVRIAIDDFGAGYSSLSYLRRLVVSQIKLDKAFIDDLPGDNESGVIVGAVIAIARRLNYQVIAEGVETEAQFHQLRDAGCDAGQGFFFGAPLSAPEIAEFLLQHRSPA